MEPSFTHHLSTCTSCPRRCGADRLAGEIGVCRTGGGIQISYAGLHHGEEPPISGHRGSGTVFFTGCNLACVFCQNYQISQEFQNQRNRTLTVDEMAGEMLDLQDRGAHNINFVSPTHVVYPMADAILAARRKGLAIPVVYNSNGYDSVEALRQIRGLVDVYLPDIKYMDNELAQRYSKANDYANIIPGVLEEMQDQVGRLQMDEDGIATRGLLVRHLVLPGQLENSRRCLQILAGLDPGIFVSIMSQYSPQYKAQNYPEIDRTLTVAEYDEITDYALELNLENAFIQELESQEHYLPSFDLEQPFESSKTSPFPSK
ncbi:MAG: radical SAM protein [Anaerolineales bacterium]|nr:radical SAM protein [Anaerolineales bacterium]